jgi:hypothetical protein
MKSAYGTIAQEVIDVIVILNALRTAWRPKHFIDMPLNL